MSEIDAAEEPPGKARSKRIFINHVDSYSGHNIGKYLSQCIVGASLEDMEEEEDGDAGSVHSAGDEASHKEGSYRIIGTLKDQNAKAPDFVTQVVNFNTREELLEHLLECDIIIYNTNEDFDVIDEAVWSVSSLHTEIEHFDGPKTFILLSTVMTWAKSKPLDPDDPEIPFTEDDYRRRKAHPNFKEHISAEKMVIKFGKTNKQKFTTYVIAAGLTYGMGENVFHFLFKTAWLGEAPALQCFGTGTNIVPTIHIRDLACVIQNVCDGHPKTRYLVAVDDSQNSLEEIVRVVSTKVGPGKVDHISKEDALLIKDLKQSEFDSLLVNLRMEAMFVKESMSVRWVAETGLVDSIEKIIKEYKNTRGLQPMRACVLGPPASGKTTLVAKICEHYKLHHIKIKDVIDEAIQKLEASAARLEQGSAEGEGEEEDEGKAQEDAELLEAVKDSRENNNGRLEDQYVIRFYREKLHSMPCQNQGFVLDGFPKTYNQAKDLFAVEDEDEGDDGKRLSYDASIMPEVVISLDSPDDEFLKNRIMNLPEELVQGTHNTEEGFLRRLHDFRQMNREDDTVLNYFDELEIHPEHINVSQFDDINYKAIMNKVKGWLKDPRNYGPTPEEKEAMERAAAEERLQQESEEREERERREAEEAELMKQRREEWMNRLEEVRKQELDVLEEQSIPLRNYLMKHVMPTLTSGLIECCQIRPGDPVDYLAEYLFKNNPQVD
ncbi:adenylate kinase 7-like isoform X2 [Styela clava]|uniref:adenylate kinase 7-like n=1 Tax=Styela clava TaxID=7725 RepID=UPI00193AC3C6|nr:adenylate kinase 7-like [Styela clava]